MEPIIQTERLSHIYSAGTPFEHGALVDVDFTAYRGEYLGIIGHTGSGKSTLIQHLNGLLKPTSGRVLFEGRDIWESKERTRQTRFQVGLVFQYPEHQLFEIDVLTDVCFGPQNQGLTKEEALIRAKEALRLAGLDESYYKRSPFELSGGQKRRVAIAGVLAMEPEVLGPAPAPVVKLNNRYRYRITVVGQNEKPLRQLLAAYMKAFARRPEHRNMAVHTDCNLMD